MAEILFKIDAKDEESMIQKKQDILNKLTNGTPVVSVNFFTQQIFSSSCTAYYNRRISEITNENHKSMKSISFKFKVDSDFDETKGSFISFVSINSNRQSNGMIAKGNLPKDFVLTPDEEYTIKFQFED